MGVGMCGLLEVNALEKAGEAKVRVRVRAITVMGFALVFQLGFLVVKRPREAKIRVKVRTAPYRYEPCLSSPVCASPWPKCDRGDSSFRPNFFIKS